MNIDNFNEELKIIFEKYKVLDAIIVFTSWDTEDADILNLNSLSSIVPGSPYEKQMKGLRRIIVTQNYFGENLADGNK